MKNNFHSVYVWLSTDADYPLSTRKPHRPLDGLSHTKCSSMSLVFVFEKMLQDQLELPVCYQ